MARARLLVAVVVLVLTALFVVGGEAPAFADDGPSVDFLASRLKSDDFRVRFNAALALGGKTGDDARQAVQPLCDAFGDEKDAVRTAIASALKRLALPAALPCLKSRQANEPSNDVKTSIARAIEAIEAAQNSGGNSGSGTPSNNPGAKYYVAYTLANNSGRPSGEVESLVFGPMKTKLDGAGTFQFAPLNESPDAARSVMQKRKLQGFYISISLEQINYVDDSSGGLTLKVKLRVAVSNYPGKALKGSFDKGVGQQVSKRGDKDAENNLINMAAGLAFDQFAQNAQMFL